MPQSHPEDARDGPIPNSLPVELQDTMLAAALEYATAGLPVFPCNFDKRSLIKNWPELASTDPEQLRAWWNVWPQAMIGLLTGARSRLYVVDIDQGNGKEGMAAYRALGVPRAVIAVRTPSGGGHAYFRWPGEGWSNTVSKIAPAIDTRGEGGYVIAPPSGNAMGTYHWVEEGMKDLLLTDRVPNLPEMLSRLLQRTQPGGGLQRPPTASAGAWAAAAVQGELSKVANAGEGTRNATLNAASFKVGQVAEVGELPPEATVAALANAAVIAGLPQSEARVTAYSGFRAGQMAPRGPTGSGGSASELAGVWPEPDLRFHRSERDAPPVFPGGVFGDAWGPWVEDAADAKGAPPDYVAGALLAVAASLIGNARWAAPFAGWWEPTIFWAMNIGNPSAGKSPAMDAVMAPLRALDARVREHAEAELVRWQEDAEVAALHQEDWQKKVRKAVKDGRSPPPRPAAASDEPHVPRLFVNDATVERLGVILAGQPRGALLIRDELAGWLTGMNRYNGGGSDRPFWIEAYGGRSFTVERVTRAAVRIDHLSIGIVGNIQPDRLASLLLKTDDDGMLARFCPFCPLLSPLKRPENVPDAAFAERAFQRLYDLVIPLGPNGMANPGLVPFTEDAQDMLQAFRERSRRWETAADGLLLSFIGKTPGFAVRLSLLFTFLDWAAGGDATPPTEIDANHFGRASHFITEYVLPMARYAYAAASVPIEERAAQRLARLLVEEQISELSTREIQRRKLSVLTTAQDIRAALEVLVSANIVRVRNVETRGRSAVVYEVNPGFLNHGAG